MRQLGTRPMREVHRMMAAAPSITIEIIMAAIILGVFTTWLQIRFPVGLLGSLLGL